MKSKNRGKFGWLAWLMSLLMGAVGFMVAALAVEMLNSIVPHKDSFFDFIINILCNIVIFGLPMVMGYLGLELALKLGAKRHAVPHKRKIASGVVLALLLSIVIGGGSQAIFSLGDVPYEETVDVQTTKDGAKVVLLLDGSYSMRIGGGSDKFTPSLEAACDLIDSLGENNYLQYAAFANNVVSRNTSMLLQLTADNKNTIKDIVRNSDLAGGTDFDKPLQLAIDTLTSSYDEKYVPVIIMLTDGEDDISDSVADALNDQKYNIHFFTIRISSGGSPTGYVKELVDLADKDFCITPAADGSLDTSQVLNAFRDAMSYTTTITETHWRLGLTDNYMFGYDQDVKWHVWNYAALLLCFALIFPATAAVYYRRIGTPKPVFNLIIGAVAGLITLILVASEPNDYFFIGPVLYIAAGVPACVTYTDAVGDGLDASGGKRLFGGKKDKAVLPEVTGQKDAASAPAPSEQKEAERNV